MFRSDSRFMPYLLRFFQVMLLASVVACQSTPPVQEMSNARQSIQAAREVQAQVLAPELMIKAEQLLKSASQFLKQGEYRAARDLAIEAQQLAVQARNQALSQQR